MSSMRYRRGSVVVRIILAVVAVLVVLPGLVWAGDGDSMYYIKGKLAAIVITTLGDWAAEVDPVTGELSGIRESR